MEIITSNSNNLVKKAKKLHQKKYRATSYLIEGWHLFEEAVATGAKIEQIFVSENQAYRVQDYSQAVIVTDSLLKELSDSPSPQGIVAVISLSEQIPASLLQGRFLLLEDIQDPGNVGTLIRTAAAAGFSAVFITDKSADIYNSKTLRSMQGSHFHLPIYRLPIDFILDKIADSQLELLASTLDKDSEDYRRVRPNQNFVLALGNEGQGISLVLRQKADKLIHIPMPGKVESLNVAVAGGILIFNLI